MLRRPEELSRLLFAHLGQGITRLQQGESTNNKITGIVDYIRSWPKALTVEQLADKLEVSAKTIYKSISRGSLPAMHIGSALRLDPAAVVAWLEARTTGRTNLRRAA